MKRHGGSPGVRRRAPGPLVLAGAAIIGLLSGCAGSGPSAAPQTPIAMVADGDITWYTWEGYVDPEVVSSFEAEYGVKVNLDYFDSDEAMVQKLAAGAPYDVITNNSAYLDRTRQAGLIRPLNWDELDTSDLIPYFEAPYYDNGDERYSIPYGVAPTGFLYRKDVVSDPASWDALWNSPEADGKITVLPQAEETVGMALLSLGYDLNSSDPDEIKQAVDKLLELKPDLAALSSSTNEDVVQGRALIAQTWTGQAFQTLQELPDPENWGFSLPADQSPVGADVLTIGANAKAPGTAQLLLDWMLKPENAAKNSAFHGYVNGTEAGNEALAAKTADYPFLQIPDSFWDTALWKVSPTGDRLDVLTQQWNRFKA